MAIVSTGNKFAARAAQEILAKGGSAVDAAISADAVMGVVEPLATSVGGDVLAMVYQPGKGVCSYNGTGRAPKGLTAECVRSLPESKIPERHPLSITVPGAVRGWHDLHQYYGELDWGLLFDASILHARNGFAVAKVAASEWSLFEHVLYEDPVCARLYCAGATPKEGDVFANPDLAETLELIACEGADAFYQGAIARDASKAVQALGGVLDRDDFYSHQGNFTQPLSLSFHGVKVHQCPPNTHGIAVLDALSDIQNMDVDTENPQAWKSVIEATSTALESAKRTVSDPSGNTVCTVIVDDHGTAVVLMSSIFKRFGSGIAVPDGGFCLQNRAFGFDEIGHINGPGPGKRPYHTVIPSISTLNGEFYLGLGVVGGLMQPQGQIQILNRIIGWGQKLQQAIDAPRWRLEGRGALAIEQGFSDGARKFLYGAGYHAPGEGIGELGGRSDFGGAHAVMQTEYGKWLGAADPRKDGDWISTY